MSAERIDDLLEQAIATGNIPADATPEERAELERMLGPVGMLRANRPAVAEEAHASMPTARARFQRYVAASTPAAATPAPAAPRSGFFGRLFGGTRTRALAGSAAAVLLLVVVALVVSQVALDETESAYAQVVQPGDYVQVEGVVDETSAGTLQLTSELGRLHVELTDSTSLLEGTSSADVSRLRKGDRVLVAGVAGQDRRLVAQTLSIGGAHEGPQPQVVSFRHLRQLQHELEGLVVTFTISSDGTHGSILIDAGDGERYLVPLDGAAAERILAQASTALGQQVRITEGSDGTEGTFSVELPATPPGPGSPGHRPGDDRGHHPSLVDVRGVVTAVAQGRGIGDRPGLTVLTVRTADDTVRVLVRPGARIFPGTSGLDLSDGLAGEAVGYTIAASGGIQRDGAILADTVVLGTKYEP